MTTGTNFLGIPVSGDITQGATRNEQFPTEDLSPLLQAVLNDPTIVEFGWRQYTPYFNDGDTCEFSVHGVWVRTTAEVGDVNQYGEEYSDYDLDADYHPSLGGYIYGYDEYGKYTRLGYKGPDEDRYNRVQALDSAIQSGRYDDALLEAFGDHAHITVNKTGIEVESYEHE